MLSDIRIYTLYTQQYAYREYIIYNNTADDIKYSRDNILPEAKHIII